MFIGGYRFKMRLFGCRSLKDKRAIRRSLISKIRDVFKVSIAEVGDLDLWNSLEIGASYVAGEIGPVRKTYDEIRCFIEDNYEVELYDEMIEVYKCEKN